MVRTPFVSFFHLLACLQYSIEIFDTSYIYVHIIPPRCRFHNRDMLQSSDQPTCRRSFAPVFSYLPGLEMDDNTPLMEAGIDSLSAVEFRNKARLGISNPGFLYELLGAVFPDRITHKHHKHHKHWVIRRENELFWRDCKGPHSS